MGRVGRDVGKERPGIIGGLQHKLLCLLRNHVCRQGRRGRGGGEGGYWEGACPQTHVPGTISTRLTQRHRASWAHARISAAEDRAIRNRSRLQASSLPLANPGMLARPVLCSHLCCSRSRWSRSCAPPPGRSQPTGCSLRGQRQARQAGKVPWDGVQLRAVGVCTGWGVAGVRASSRLATAASFASIPPPQATHRAGCRCQTSGRSQAAQCRSRSTGNRSGTCTRGCDSRPTGVGVWGSPQQAGPAGAQQGGLACKASLQPASRCVNEPAGCQAS